MVPSTAASIDWRFEAFVAAESGLSPVVVQPASARLPKASAAVVFRMKFRLCIVFLRRGSWVQPRFKSDCLFSYITRGCGERARDIAKTLVRRAFAACGEGRGM